MFVHEKYTVETTRTGYPETAESSVVLFASLQSPLPLPLPVPAWFSLPFFVTLCAGSPPGQEKDLEKIERVRAQVIELYTITLARVL